MPLLSSGTAAPGFTLSPLDGRELRLAGALAGGPLLVVFFKVNCPTCQYAMPFIERLYQQFRAQGVQIWGISQDNARDSRRFIEEYGLSFPVLINDYPYEVADAYGIHHVPTLFLIDGDGHIELVSDGFDKSDLLTIQKWFAKHFSVAIPALFLPGENVPEFKPG